ncbi:MAG: hypothetical protein OXH92_04490 [Bryobacterales bacterium]|nr:hypothetical protein [Bryobacterales bacterium]MDE0293779.1 hypothetical protein [Bryobacterales bacterium]MDE0433243.1 hypothetical protein [Bryobacterales bacterium]
MTAPHRDPGLDTLLELHDLTLFVDEIGHWVKFVVRRTDVTEERPHGLSYSLTLHAPDGARLVGVRQCASGEGTAGSGNAETPRERPSSPAAEHPSV